MRAKYWRPNLFETHSTSRCASLLSLLLLFSLGLSPLASTFAKQHEQNETKQKERTQLAYAESFIDAFYSFDPAQLAPLMATARNRAAGSTFSSRSKSAMFVAVAAFSTPLTKIVALIPLSLPADAACSRIPTSAGTGPGRTA